MSIFEVIGGKKLSGEITPQGAKNEALQIISAVLLTKEEVVINNIPDIIDVNLLIELLKEINVKVEQKSRHSFSFKADDVNVDYLSSEEFHKKSVPNIRDAFQNSIRNLLIQQLNALLQLYLLNQF